MSGIKWSKETLCMECVFFFGERETGEYERKKELWMNLQIMTSHVQRKKRTTDIYDDFYSFFSSSSLIYFIFFGYFGEKHEIIMLKKKEIFSFKFFLLPVVLFFGKKFLTSRCDSLQHLRIFDKHQLWVCVILNNRFLRKKGSKSETKMEFFYSYRVKWKRKDL